MEKLLKPYDKEFMRMAMLKHEETFKEQVYELHRLYRIQKMLMNSVGVGDSKQQNQQERKIQHDDDDERELADQISKRIGSLDNQRLQAQRNADDQVGMRASDHHQERIAESNNNQSMMLDESEIELTLSLGPSTYNPRRPRTDKSESGQSVSSSSTGSSQTRRTSPKTNSSSTRDFKWGNSSSSNNNNNNNNTFPHKGSESDPGFASGQQNNPPWMFQALSLKLS